MKTFNMHGDNYYRGAIAFGGKTHVLVGNNYEEAYCGTQSKDDRFYGDDDFHPEQDMGEISCQKCRRSFSLDYLNYKRSAER